MKITEIDGLTDTVIERDATPEEIEAIEKEQKAYADAKAAEEAAQAKAAKAKADLLDRLGITEEEASLLLG